MNFLLLLPAVLSCLLLAAHFLRSGQAGLVALCLLAPLLLLIRRQWVHAVFPLLLLAGAALWIGTAFNIREERLLLDKPWLRLAIIIGAVAAFTIAAAL